MSTAKNTNDLEQTVNDLATLIDAAESVNWRQVSEVPTSDVASWIQRLEYAKKVEQRDLEDDRRVRSHDV
jgi:hypothetical protein